MRSKQSRPTQRLLETVSDKFYSEFERAGAFISEHIPLHNGRCVEIYANFTRLLNLRGPVLWKLCDTIFDCYIPASIRKNPHRVVFVGVGSGAHFANILADHWARKYCKDADDSYLCFAYAERDPMCDGIYFGRHQAEVVRGKRVIVVDDVFVSGATLSRLCSLVLSSGGKIEKCLVLLNRSRQRRERIRVEKRLIKLSALCHHYIPSFTRKRCPSCKKKIPWSRETAKGLEVFHLGQEP